MRIGEILMHLHHPHLQIIAKQFDLFASDIKSDAELVLPQWQSLPEETRQSLTSLLTRLILDHASGNRPRSSEEVHHDV
jgi:hypothetical protein